MVSFVAIGEILWDIYDDSKNLGGAPLNFLGIAHQMGANSTIISRVGQDPSGQELQSSLEAFNINTNYLQIDPQHQTGQVLVKLDSQGVPHFDILMDVAYDFIQYEEPVLSRINQEADLFYVGTLAQRHENSRTTIQKYLNHLSEDVVVAYDINIRGWNEELCALIDSTLTRTNILKLNEEELELVIHNLLKKELKSQNENVRILIDHYQLSMVVLTKGSKGLSLFERNKPVQDSSILNIEAVDTTGCGDASFAAICYGYCQKWNLQKIVEYGNLMGAFIAMHSGALPQFTLEDFESFVSENYSRSL